MNISPTLLDWYATSARRLPWREPDATPWAILVSEIMLQQTPVARVIPVYLAWMQRWPKPADLAKETPGDAVRMWAKLGYPRRALRLHECARVLVADHGGEVPADIEALLRLPGIGDYTARAVAAFAFGQRHPVIDTTVRRVLARVVLGQAEAGPVSVRRELTALAPLLPPEPAVAATFSVALMELGAVICTARAPRCDDCVLAADCGWRQAGHPAYAGPTTAPQRFLGTDRQVRGLLLDVLRADAGPVERSRLDAVWADPVQRDRALDTLLVDGLIHGLPDGRFALPT
jgi:A/G-specific adenine glycosylase